MLHHFLAKLLTIRLVCNLVIKKGLLPATGMKEERTSFIPDQVT
jgi:hypothetical protein